MKKIILLCIVTLSGPVRHLLLLLLLAGGVEGSLCFSQQDTGRYIHKGLLRAQATICPGVLLKENATMIYIHGCLEYYVADNVSVRGDSYYDVMAGNTKKETGPLGYNHSTFAGVAYHFKTKNHFDPYFSFEPGISITKGNDYSGIICDPGPCLSQGETSANPLLSTAVGFNLYFEKWFHLFGEAKYVSGKYLSDAYAPKSLNELRFSFGLGFNLNLLKKK